MSKFNTCLVKGLKEKEKQNKLKEKHNVSKEVVVVAKSDVPKIIYNIIKNTIKVAATLIILTLACIGLYMLLEEDSRQMLFSDVQKMIEEILQ